jgi:hypothetical protein
MLTIGSALESRLATCTPFLIDESNCSLRFSGRLNLSHDDVKTQKHANCEFVVQPDFAERKPDVYCRDSWIKGDWDWHANSSGWICYELPDRWFDLVSNVVKEQGEARGAQFAAEWCLHSTRWLLYRHYIASAQSIRKWPKDWPQWSHGDAGVREYRGDRKN